MIQAGHEIVQYLPPKSRDLFEISWVLLRISTFRMLRNSPKKFGMIAELVGGFNPFEKY